MNTHYTYFIILAIALAGPLALSFDKKVAFYTKWKFVFPAMIIPAVIYIAWDVYFTSANVWGFNQAYVTGIKCVNLPVEEVLFFFVIPYCCTFIYECILCYFPGLQPSKITDYVFKVLALVLLIFGLVFFARKYTTSTFLSTSLFILILLMGKGFFSGFNSKLFLVSFLISIIPFLIVNGYLTALPVVIYNNDENLGIRIYTIPFEDLFYGMLLMLMNIAGYERLRRKKT